MKIAIVHDQLQEFGGAERVFIALKRIFEDADVFTAFYNKRSLKKHVPDYKNWKIKTSWAHKVPFLKKLYSPLRFLTPWIWESFDFSGYDLVISSSGWYMPKGIITRPETVHICYLHHQPRYLYFYETALEWQRYKIIRIYANIINHTLRLWDYLSSQRVDYFLVNSFETKKRVKKFYRRDADVIYPPVSIPPKTSNSYHNYYITVSRLVKTKHIDILIEAANRLKIKLKIVGNGKEIHNLKFLAGDTVEFLQKVSDSELAKLYGRAKGFLFASVDEEFGIAPVEAMGHGVPVVAFKSGGLIETVKDNYNGYLFEGLTPEALIEKIKIIEQMSKTDYEKLRKNARKTAEKFSEVKFKENILKFVEKVKNA